MVARAVLLKPRLIVADEPVSMVDASLRATILDELRTLNRELDISIAYITHDLTTAFQICDNIVILYRGAVAEAGSVQRVIGDPKHPYSQLLVSSIPLANFSKPWGGEEVDNAEPLGSTPASGCPFAPRCPHAMEVCSKERPAKFVLDRHRLAACFLYRDAPVLKEPNIATVFRPLEQALAAKRV
jgi:peptide/nickel transport system ATP-binding protein